ncbi:MAG TPA: DUF5916 domain-containing protein [Longimicrobiales bacterium]
MRHRVMGVAVVVLLAVPGALSARQARTPEVGAAPGMKRVVAVSAGSEPPRLDGVLDDAAWALAEPATGFVQMRPNPGAAATRPTEARVVYDASAIYVGMRLYDHPDSVAAQLARRDASGIFTDWAHVVIDSYHDRRTAFRFSVTPRGTKKDVLHFDDVGEDLNWDAVWDVAVRLDSLGWTAEFRIPLSQLRFSANDGGGMVWGVNFGRQIARRGEWSWWSPVLPDAGGFVSESGELHGLAGLDAGRRLELMPYTVAGLTLAPADPGNPFYEASDPLGNVGVDVRYGITSNLTLSATINPDFGQVEADPSVVNLSAFETFYPEKRPFFTEGSNLFEFDIGTDDGSGEALFYSRRIGRAPQRGVGGDGYVDAPDATTILGAAKLSGKTSGGWTIGLLSAVTAEERARVAAPGGAVAEEPVEPLTHYLVGSFARDFRHGRSSVGVLFTGTHRRLGADGAFESLPSAAYAAGLRGRHRFADGAWEASGYVAASHVRGSEAAIERLQLAPARYYQRPDADHVAVDPTRTSLTGAVANVGLWKIGGSIRGGVGGHVRTPGFEVNDLGFQGEADTGLLFGNLRYHQFEPKGVFRNFVIGINPSLGWTTGGEHTWTQVGHWANGQFTNFWSGGWWMGWRPAASSTTALRGGPAIARPASFRYDVWLEGDARKPVVWSVGVSGGREFDGGGHDLGVGLGLTVRPSPSLNLSLRPRIVRNRPTWQYVGQPESGGERHYVVGALDQTTASLTTRLNWTLSPTLSLELYAQPFISGGEYTTFRRVADPRADAFADRFEPLDATYDAAADTYRADLDGDGAPDLSFADPDFNFKQMRGNAVLRWEYRRGSTLYLVWSQSRTAYLAGGDAHDARLDLGRDVNRLFNRDEDCLTPVTNVFMIKVSYWLNG